MHRPSSPFIGGFEDEVIFETIVQVVSRAHTSQVDTQKHSVDNKNPIDKNIFINHIMCCYALKFDLNHLSVCYGRKTHDWMFLSNNTLPCMI